MDAITAWVADHSLAEVQAAMVAARVPAGPILSTAELMREHFGWPIDRRRRLTERGYLVIDLNSTNGTFINGSRVNTPANLKVGTPVRIGKTTFTTSLFPKDGGYLVPIKNVVRIPEKLELGQNVGITITLSA